MEPSWVGLHGSDFGITQNSGKGVGDGAAASQMAVTAVLFVRTDGEHRNATATETTSVFENSYPAHYPRLLAVRFDPEGCFVSRERSEKAHEHTQYARQSQRIQSVTVDVCTQSACVQHGGHGQHRSDHDGAKPENLNGPSERVFADTSASPYFGA